MPSFAHSFLNYEEMLNVAESGLELIRRGGFAADGCGEEDHLRCASEDGNDALVTISVHGSTPDLCHQLSQYRASNVGF
jgi:hypothetical protein